MNTFELYMLVFFLGFLLGGGLVGWVFWSYLHEKIETLSSELHGRFTVFEHSVLSKVHLVSAQPKQPAPAASVAPAPTSAPEPTPAAPTAPSA